MGLLRVRRPADAAGARDLDGRLGAGVRRALRHRDHRRCAARWPRSTPGSDVAAGLKEEQPHHRERQPQLGAQRADRGAGGLLLHAADRRRPDGPQLHPAAAGGPGLRAAARLRRGHRSQLVASIRSATQQRPRCGRRHHAADQTPGVLSAAVSSSFPDGCRRRRGGSPCLPDRRRQPAETEMPPLQSRQRVTPDYFRTLGIPLIAGRAFREFDTEESSRWRSVNRSLARRTWKNEDPVGSRITFDGEHWMQIVGIVGDVRSSAAGSRPEQLYRPMAQSLAGSVLVRTVGDPETLTARCAALSRMPIRRWRSQGGDAGRGPHRSGRVAADHRAVCSACSPPWRW